jgi:hypothetical protein
MYRVARYLAARKLRGDKRYPPVAQVQRTRRETEDSTAEPR